MLSIIPSIRLAAALAAGKSPVDAGSSSRNARNPASGLRSPWIRCDATPPTALVRFESANSWLARLRANVRLTSER